MSGSITISASYGARGAVIGHAVAERLGLPLLDRAIPIAAARRLHLSENSADALDERAPSRWTRLAAAFEEFGPSFGSSMSSAELLESPDTFREATERVLHEVANTTGAVIIGRAGMVVLANRPDVLSVRLDGNVEARIAQAVADGTPEGEARAKQKDADGARESYSTFFYKVSQSDPSKYHLVIDSTVLSTETCIELITTAAKERFQAP